MEKKAFRFLVVQIIMFVINVFTIPIFSSKAVCASNYPINCNGSSGGHRVWQKLRHLLMLCKNFLVTSSLMMCAPPSFRFSCNFSRALLS